MTRLETTAHRLLQWLKAARPHTLGLSVAVILAGSGQVGWAAWRGDILLLALLSAVGFQLISNFANDYGDFVKGTDAHRNERYRALSGGNFTAAQVRAAIVILSVLSLLAVATLVYRAPVSLSGKWVMLGLGVLSVAAALLYTLGKHPYGYYALGDIMVFVFFGIVGIVGSYYLQDGRLANPAVWLVAVVFGAFSVSVLNINNIRDAKKDRKNHKKTVANLLGKRALHYQQGLFGTALVALLLYALVSWGLGTVVLGLAVWFIRQINLSLYRAKSHGDYNRCLAMTVKYTLWLSLPTAIVGLCTF